MEAGESKSISYFHFYMGVAGACVSEYGGMSATWVSSWDIGCAMGDGGIIVSLALKMYGRQRG